MLQVAVLSQQNSIMPVAEPQVDQITTAGIRAPQPVLLAIGNASHVDDDDVNSRQENNLPVSDDVALVDPLYSVLTSRQKRTAVMIVSFVAMISPLSGNIYYPATTALAKEFKVSESLIQLTITTYQVT
jgi:Ca2+/Na+ antiporter